jgi:hypothetical protein
MGEVPDNIHLLAQQHYLKSRMKKTTSEHKGRNMKDPRGIWDKVNN